MDLSRHLAVMWRFRAITFAGIALGIVFAILAAYKPSLSGFEKRGAPTYTSQSSLLVTQTGFPEGRVVLPTAPAGEEPNVSRDSVGFADPARFMALTDLYTKLILSDEVRRRIPERPAASQIDASAVAAVSGAPILPIIQLTAQGASPAAARQLNMHTITALRGLLRERQARNAIPPGERVQIGTLNASSPGVLTASPSHTASILAFLLTLIGTVALTHLLEALRLRREGSDVDDVAFEWPLEHSPEDDDLSESAVEFLELPGHAERR
jgi:hypothetical protein